MKTVKLNILVTFLYIVGVFVFISANVHCQFIPQCRTSSPYAYHECQWPPLIDCCFIPWGYPGEGIYYKKLD